MVQGFEDIGIRFTVQDGAVKIMVPKNITLSEWEKEMLRFLKPAIKDYVEMGLLMPVDA